MGYLGPRAIPWCSNVTTTYCMTEPWQYSRDGHEGNGFVWFLNFILAFVFPLIPWEVRAHRNRAHSCGARRARGR